MRSRFNDWKLKEALPLFEKLAVRYPEDAQVFETYGMIMILAHALSQRCGGAKDARGRSYC